MPSNFGTNLFAGNTGVQVALTDIDGNAVLSRGTVANLPSAVAGYAVSGVYQATDSGALYLNTGTVASATFTLMDTASTSLQLPEAATDASTTSGTSLALTMNTVNTGIGMSIALNGLTSGEGVLLSHTTAVIADGGSMLRVTSSSIDTGGTTNGTLLDLKSTGQLAGTTARLDTILTTGTALSIISTGVMTTTGNLLTLTADSATTAAGILRINATGLSSGNAAVITTSSSSTDGGTSFEPVKIATTMTGVGGVGGRFKSSLTTNVALGAWSNAIKGEVTYQASGKTTGLGSAILGEMTLSAGTADGTYAPLELELNLATGALTGTQTSLIYAGVNGDDASTFDTSGNLLSVNGLTAGASNVFRTGLTAGTVNAACTAALRIKVDGVDYFIPLATATA